MSTLSDLMDFGRVIITGSDGQAKPLGRDLGDTPRVDAPEEVQYVDLDADGGASDPVAPDGWEYLTGFTGQYGYSGSVMHASEFIGGALERHILSTPGYYVAVIIDGDPFEPEHVPGMPREFDSVDVGWGVLHYIGGAR